VPTHDLPHPRTAPRFRRALTLSASVLTALLTTAPAAVAGDSGKGDQPPASMSTIGGALLGEPGTQVTPLDGAPRLPDTLSARSWIVADAETGEVLAAHNAHWPLAPASTMKMLLADTLLPKFGKDQEYVAQPEHFVEMGAGSSAVGISDHQTYTVDDLWHGVFLASGNDAVYALAAMNGGKKKTVEEMNERAAELQALDTNVVNPDGYDGKGQVSSAYDLTLIARSGMRNEQFRAYAATGSFDFPGAGKGRKRETFQVRSIPRLPLPLGGRRCLMARYDPDVMVIRHGQIGAPQLAARYTSAHVVNAGDGTHQHPTQALLDLYTIDEELGGVDGLHVAIVGDVLHSRVARSNVQALVLMGARVTLVGPPPLIPRGIASMGCEVSHDIGAIRAADVVYVLRMQRERMLEGANYVPSLREYTARWGVTPERLRPGQKVMHPGPMNRGVEIDPAVADADESLVERQVRSGLVVRMAVLYDLLTQGPVEVKVAEIEEVA
jgi:serine-type D-Ala-D-Ala carboxypeptidase (penicillin-binding protein 5/6)